MRQSKEMMRAGLLARRSLLAEVEVLAWSARIQASALEFPPYVNSRSLALYSSIQNEVATDLIRDHALIAEKQVFFPQMGSRESLALVQIESVSDLSKRRFGILEPIGGRQWSFRSQQELVVFVPGVAFDSQGRRLGRGKSCYDRLIRELEGALLIGLAYDFQIVEEVPTDPWDQRVHYVISERRVIDCRPMPEASDRVS